VWMFCEQVSDDKQSDVVRSLVESINEEAANSLKCLRDACCHLLPVMQLAVTKLHPVLSDCSGNQLAIFYFSGRVFIM